MKNLEKAFLLSMGAALSACDQEGTIIPTDGGGTVDTDTGLNTYTNTRDTMDSGDSGRDSGGDSGDSGVVDTAPPLVSEQQIKTAMECFATFTDKSEAPTSSTFFADVAGESVDPFYDTSVVELWDQFTATSTSQAHLYEGHVFACAERVGGSEAYRTTVDREGDDLQIAVDLSEAWNGSAAVDYSTGYTGDFVLRLGRLNDDDTFQSWLQRSGENPVRDTGYSVFEFNGITYAQRY